QPAPGGVDDQAQAEDDQPQAVDQAGEQHGHPEGGGQRPDGGQGQHTQVVGAQVLGAGRVLGRDAGQAAQGDGPGLPGAAPVALLLDQDQAGEARPGAQQQQ